VPNLFQQRTSVSYLNAVFSIRGVGEFDPQGEPSVPIYVDGVYIPKVLGSQQELLDIERLEVARGPQGQSFGHSAEGGTISITTTVPDKERKFKAQLAYGNYNDVRAGIAASGPLGGDFYGGVALSYHRRDGFDRNVTVGRDVNTVNYLAGRIKLRYAPGDRLDVILTISGVHDRSTVRGVQDALRGNTNAYNQVYPWNRYDQLSASLAVRYALNDRLTLSSLTSAYGFYQHAFYDNTGDYYARTSQLVTYKDRAYQEDLKLEGDSGIAHFTAGLYLFREEWYTNRRAIMAANAPVNPAALLYQPVYAQIQQNTDNIAPYAQAALALTPRATLTWACATTGNATARPTAFVAGRQRQPHRQPVQHPASDQQHPRRPADLVDRQSPRQLGHLGPAHRLRLSLLVERARLCHALGRDQVGRLRLSRPVGGDRAAPGLHPFNPERAINYEGGIKTEWAGGRLRANLSGFYIDFRNIQVTALDPVAQISRRFNAGRGKSHGIEFEGTAIPVQGLQLDFNASWLKARLDRYDGPVTSVTYANGVRLYSSPRAGNALPNSPEWQARFAATWQVPVRMPGRWSLGGDVNYQSSSYSAITNNFSDLVPAQTYFNAALSYTTANEAWAFALGPESGQQALCARGRLCRRECDRGRTLSLDQLQRSAHGALHGDVEEVGAEGRRRALPAAPPCASGKNAIALPHRHALWLPHVSRRLPQPQTRRLDAQAYQTDAAGDGNARPRAAGLPRSSPTWPTMAR
jgi:iron complex outermembrane receptor protein